MGLYQLTGPVSGICFALAAARFRRLSPASCAAASAQRKQRQTAKYLFTGLLLSECAAFLCMTALYSSAPVLAKRLLGDSRCTLPAAHSCAFSSAKCRPRSHQRLLLWKKAGRSARCLPALGAAGTHCHTGSDCQSHDSLWRTARRLGRRPQPTGRGDGLAYLLCVLPEYSSKERRAEFQQHSLPWEYKRYMFRRTDRLFFFRFVTLLPHPCDSPYVFPAGRKPSSLGLLQSLEAVQIPARLILFGSSSEEALSIYGVLTGMALPFLFFPFALTNSVSVLLAAFCSGSAVARG